jgi:cob(I)alamin adenosyltransferase
MSPLDYRRPAIVFRLPWLVCLLALSGTCAGQSDAPQPSSAPETVADAGVTETLIEQERKVLKDSESFSEEQQKRALAQLDEARAWVQEADKLRAEREALQASIAAAPEEVKRLRAKRAEPRSDPCRAWRPSMPSG